MANPKGKPATYADLERLPENMVGEIIEGELVASPRPASPHAWATAAIHLDLGSPFGRGSGGPGGWWILVEPELHLHRDVIVPDLAGWRRERMPVVPNIPAFELPPDWVCESLSPSTARYDRVRKSRIYARERVAHYWLVDALARTLEVFALENKHWSLVAQHEGDEKVRVPPFDAIEIELSRWWLVHEETPR